MKKVVGGVVLGMCFFCSTVFGQVRIDRRVMLDSVDVSQSGDSLVVDFAVVVDARELLSKECVTLVPHIGDMVLPEIRIKGGRRARADKRVEVFTGRDGASEARPGLEMVVRGRRPVSARYRYAVPGDEGMVGLRVIIESYLKTCCEESNHLLHPLVPEPVRTFTKVEAPVAVAVAESKPEPKPAEPVVLPDVSGMVSWFTPEEEKRKRRQENLTAHINYPQGGMVILPDFGDNAAELARIDRTVASIMSNRLYDLKGVHIDGYASIEGTLEANEVLARRRVEEFRKWFAARHDRPGSITTKGHGEDWNGLTAMVEADVRMPGRDGVLHIIETVDVLEGREKQLMDLDAGVPYRYMYRHFFPRLRRMEITFDYQVIALEGQEATEALASRPEDLSHAEMLRTLRASGAEQNAIYKIVVARFPDDPVALINASSVALCEKDLPRAWSYLEKVQNDPRAVNNVQIYNRLLDIQNAPR